MKKNEQITQLSEEIMVDITNSRLPLHNVLLKASRLSLLLNIPDNVKLFGEWAKYAEENLFITETFKANIEAAKDPDISVSSANPQQIVWNPMGNTFERNNVRLQAQSVIKNLAFYRAETYKFVLGIYTKWQFGNIVESIFEKKRSKTDPILQQIFPDVNQRLNSIEHNIRSGNPEDWKNAVVSCRTLIMDIADILNPPRTSDDKNKYINRLKEFVSPRLESSTQKDVLTSLLEEIKKRLEYTSNLTQGGAHKDRPLLGEAENAVLYTYLIISDLMEIYRDNNKQVK